MTAEGARVRPAFSAAVPSPFHHLPSPPLPPSPSGTPLAASWDAFGVQTCVVTAVPGGNGLGAGEGHSAVLGPSLMSLPLLLHLQKHVVETFFGFDEESVDSETLSETSCNTDRTDRAPATPEEDLDDVSKGPPLAPDSRPAGPRKDLSLEGLCHRSRSPEGRAPPPTMRGALVMTRGVLAACDGLFLSPVLISQRESVGPCCCLCN